MRYVSTRGEAPELGFEDVMLAGLAADGGLYVPATWPHLSESHLWSLSTAPYEEVAFHVMQPFVADSVPEESFRQIIAEAYASFRHPAVTPLKQLDDSLWLQELFHGPTLAFKDVAMQLLARLMDRALESRGTRATIVGATSGDTGGAAIEAFKASRNASIFILHPHGRVSDREGALQRPKIPRKSKAFRRQLDQLGPHHGADGLLFHRRPGPRRAGPRRLLHRPNR
jgi:threonine synthase